MNNSSKPATWESTVFIVEPDWIDYNGHLNMAYYNVLFDRAVDELYEFLGIGASYAASDRHTVMTAEIHVRYRRELLVNAPVRIRIHLLGFDKKRLHYFEELNHVDEGWLAASSENLALHVDMTSRRVVPWPPAIADKLGKMRMVHQQLPTPSGIGRSISMTPRR